ncbi:MAG: type I secretion C-terminal target domain-containing protein [Alphaproteobacteria bacterium]|nr:type I secretion C-terminal target domain-containing protein [Alphaproteobacteria bacterium]
MSVNAQSVMDRLAEEMTVLEEQIAAGRGDIVAAEERLAALEEEMAGYLQGSGPEAFEADSESQINLENESVPEAFEHDTPDQEVPGQEEIAAVQLNPQAEEASVSAPIYYSTAKPFETLMLEGDAEEESAGDEPSASFLTDRQTLEQEAAEIQAAQNAPKSQQDYNIVLIVDMEAENGAVSAGDSGTAGLVGALIRLLEGLSRYPDGKILVHLTSFSTVANGSATFMITDREELEGALSYVRALATGRWKHYEHAMAGALDWLEHGALEKPAKTVTCFVSDGVPHRYVHLKNLSLTEGDGPQDSGFKGMGSEALTALNVRSDKVFAFGLDLKKAMMGPGILGHDGKLINVRDVRAFGDILAATDMIEGFRFVAPEKQMPVERLLEHEEAHDMPAQPVAVSLTPPQVDPIYTKGWLCAQWDDAELLTGNAESGSFVFESIKRGLDVIRDFNPEQGDILDLSSMIRNYDPSQQDIRDFIFAREIEGGSILSVDINGSGDVGGAVDLIALEGLSRINIPALVESGNIYVMQRR